MKKKGIEERPAGDVPEFCFAPIVGSYSQVPSPLVVEGNPLFDQDGEAQVTVDPEALTVPATFAKDRRQAHKRDKQKFFRKESAAQAIERFTKTTDVFGFTKGQFSLVELIEATLDKIGPADLTVSTWTAANADLDSLHALLQSGQIRSARFLIDFTFQRRQPGTAKLIRELFGTESLRVTRNHAKFFQLSNNAGWSVTCKTSMNLNKNPRFEDFDISNDHDLFVFLDALMADLWRTTKAKKQEGATVKEHLAEFRGIEK